MNNDESQRLAMGNPGNRNMGQPKYPEKMQNYSPSTAFNYSPATGLTGGQQNPRRRNDRFKREPNNLNDRVIKQNDIIIRLLKEIRDRLPAPAVSALKSVEGQDSPGSASDPYDAEGTDDPEPPQKDDNQDLDTSQ
jgi:hypothetical protein